MSTKKIITGATGYEKPDPKAVVKPQFSQEELRHKVLVNCQIENPDLAYDDVWGKPPRKQPGGQTPPTTAPKPSNRHDKPLSQPAASSARGSALVDSRGISELDTEALMQGLGSTPLAASNSVDTWIAAAGYYPGSTRVPGTVLYAKYLEWLGEAKPLCVSAWGKVMTARFKKGKSNTGYFYYISRETLVEMEAKLSEGGIGNSRGG